MGLCVQQFGCILISAVSYQLIYFIDLKNLDRKVEVFPFSMKPIYTLACLIVFLWGCEQAKPPAQNLKRAIAPTNSTIDSVPSLSAYDLTQQFFSSQNLIWYNFYPDQEHSAKITKLFPTEALVSIKGLGNKKFQNFKEINDNQLDVFVFEYQDTSFAQRAFQDLADTIDNIVTREAMEPDLSASIYSGNAIYSGSFIFRYKENLIQLVQRCGTNVLSLPWSRYNQTFLSQFYSSPNQLSIIQSHCGSFKFQRTKYSHVPIESWKPIKDNLYKLPNGNIAFASNPATLNQPQDKLTFEDCPNQFLKFIGNSYSIPLSTIIDTASFRHLHGNYFIDRKNVYHHYTQCDGGYLNIFSNDTSSFKGINADYIRFKDSIYHDRIGAINADPNSFEVSNQHGFLAKDKNGYFSHGIRILKETLMKEAKTDSIQHLF